MPMRLTTAPITTLRLLSEGLSNRLIARRMACEEEAVKNRVRALLDKSGSKNRTQLAVWAIRTRAVPCPCGEKHAGCI